jgi:hypothetical protein
MTALFRRVRQSGLSVEMGRNRVDIDGRAHELLSDVRATAEPGSVLRRLRA